MRVFVGGWVWVGVGGWVGGWVWMSHSGGSIAQNEAKIYKFNNLIDMLETVTVSGNVDCMQQSVC